MKLFEITDRSRPTKTRTRTTTATDPLSGASAFGNTREKQLPQTRQQTQTPALKTARPETTRRKTADIAMSANVADKLSTLHSLGLQDEISDEVAATRAGYTDPRKSETTDLVIPSNLPDIINNQLAAAGMVQPEWHMVKHLPGYLSTAIRALGRQVFGAFTSTPIEDVQVLANVQGQGPNSTRELNAVAGWLQQHGDRNTDGEIDFEKTIPSYGAEFQLYTADGATFLVVKDFAGQYIYSWPTDDEY